MTNKNYSKILLLVSAVLTVLAVAVLLVFGGNTYASFTFANLSFNLFLKAFILTVLVFAVTTGYFFIRFKKNGLYLGIFTALSAVISGVVAFDLCVLCRAPLGDLTFAVMLLCVAVVYVTSVIFANNFKKASTKKKKQKDSASAFETAVVSTRKSFAIVFAVIIVTLVSAAILTFVFSGFTLALCAAPSIIATAYSIALTLEFGCRYYADKI